MLIEYEDKRFYKHIGFDPFAISRATFQYLKNREIHSGASTITMQLVRMLEPKDRNIFSVQYHPEAGPGPNDGNYLFDQFLSKLNQ